MIIVGLALMLGGWRMGAFCVVATYAIVGGLAGFYFAAGRGDTMLWVGAAAVVVGALSLLARRIAIPVLGGVIGAGVVMQVLASLGLHDWPLWISGVAALGSLIALCWAHARNVVIMITSFEGALILISGLIPIMASSPGLFRFFQGLTRSSDVFLPFLLTVPTLAGVFLQMADARNKDSGMTQA
jgi:hypothetical protein